jgi:hypothetical protein
METIDEISFGGAFHGEGWHPSEGEQDSVYRWMSSGATSRLSVIADRTRAVQVSCTLVAIITSEVIEHLDIFVDGQLVEFYVSTNENFMKLKFVIPCRPRSPVAVIEFKVEKEFLPTGADKRRISMAFNKIEVAIIDSDTIKRLLNLNLEVF